MDGCARLTGVRATVPAAAEFAGLLALWVLFTGNLNRIELAAGALAAAASVAAFEFARRAQPVCFRPSISMLRPMWRMPFMIARDTRIVAWELVRRMRGKRRSPGFRATPFRATGPDCRSAARRTLATLFATIPPNSIVIGVDRDSRTVLLHLLRADAAPSVIATVESA